MTVGDKKLLKSCAATIYQTCINVNHASPIFGNEWAGWNSNLPTLEEQLACILDVIGVNVHTPHTFQVSVDVCAFAFPWQGQVKSCLVMCEMQQYPN